MFSFLSIPKRALAAVLALGLLSSCIHKKYETPITKNTQQPDKILFDAAIHDIERGRYEVARISLQTLMNTYESSEFLAKAKLAIADSWFREGGSNGLAQAEAEYKDFQLFYPQMEESAQAQDRVCDIHYKQMDKSDRDIIQTLRAESECKDLITVYPNSKFVPGATQKLRDIQESLAEHEFAVGEFYWERQMNPAASNRLNALVEQYPLYSGAGEALYEAGDSYSKMGPRFRKQAGDMFSRVVSDYPLSPRVKEATKRLTDMELPVPSPSQEAMNRAKREQESVRHVSLPHRSLAWMKGSPDLSHSAQNGAPTMTDPKKTIPASIPVPTGNETASASATGKTDVTADTTAATPTSGTAPAPAAAAGTPPPETPVKQEANTPLPTNRDKELEQLRARQKKQQDKMAKKKKKPSQPDQAAPAATTPATPPATTPGTTPSAAPASATPTTTTPPTPQQ